MDEKQRIFTVLCIDGGGVRGLIPARILEEIETRTGKPISELFDIVGGPSTGSIVAAGLSVPDPENPKKPKFTARDMKNFYYVHTPNIFPKKSLKLIRQITKGALYDPKPLDDALLDAFGDAQLKDSLTHIMVPATDIKNFRPVWLNHFKNEKDHSLENWSSMLTRDAIRGSTTAPTFFPCKWVNTQPPNEMKKHMEKAPHADSPYRHALIDGGFFSGNVLPRMLKEARRLAPPDAKIVFVHLGTGATENNLSPEEFNKMGPVGLLRSSVLMSLIVNMSLIDSIKSLEEELGERFVSIDGRMSAEEGSMPIDDATPSGLARMENFAEKIIREQDGYLNHLCEVLGNKSHAEALHQKSLAATIQLTTMMEELDGIRSLARLYRQILAYSEGRGKVVTPQDNEIKTLAEKLTDYHKEVLEINYAERQQAIAKYAGFTGFCRKTGKRLSDLFSSRSKKDDTNKKPPENANDNDKKNPPSKHLRHPRLGGK